MVENVSNRNAAFLVGLKTIDYEIKRLGNIIRRVPPESADISEDLRVNAFGVMEAALNFVRKQLRYQATFGREAGDLPPAIVTYLSRKIR